MSEPTTVTVTTKNTPALTMGIISIVLGVLGLLISWIPLLGMLAIPVAVIGIVLAIIGLVLALVKNAGWSMPLLGVVICVMAISVVASVTGAVANAFKPRAGLVETSKESRKPMGTLVVPNKFTYPEAAPVEGVTVEALNVRVEKRGFIPALKANFVVANQSPKAIKDFTVTVHIHGGSGTIIGNEAKTFYDVLNPGEALEYADQDMGSPRTQGVSYTATVKDYKPVD